jgi:hypothetical protein
MLRVLLADIDVRDIRCEGQTWQLPVDHLIRLMLRAIYGSRSSP